MKYLLDTNICIYIINQRPQKVLKHVYESQPGDLAVSSITAAELYYGVAKSQAKSKNTKALEQFLMPLDIVVFDDLAAQHYGDIRAHLAQKGSIIGSLDLLIAAHARALHLPLVTNNLKEFKRVPNLRCLSWC